MALSITVQSVARKPIMEIFYGEKTGFYGFGYNSIESEPIWMKYWGSVSTMLGAGPGRFWA